MLQIEECIEKLKNEIADIRGSAEGDFAGDFEVKMLLDAVGEAAAEDVYSGIDIPEFPKSAMDGYAVRSEDVISATQDSPVILKVIGENLAGDHNEFKCEPGTAVRIMTGAFIPDGYNAVVKQEDTKSEWDNVEVYKGVKPFMNYCKKGEDLKKGERILERDKKISSLDLALLAAAGIDRVSVKRRLKVSILSTGSELTEPGNELAPGAIYQNISYYLAALMQGKGVDVISSGICRDDEDEIIASLKELSESSDIIITTGGVSVGKKDLLPEVLSRLGADILFRGANIQPGTPTMASVIKDTSGRKRIVLSLSGNPYAAFTNFEIYFWQAASVFLSDDNLLPYRTIAAFKGSYDKKNFHRRFIRAYYKNGEVSIPSDRHMSSVISNLHECNAFIDLEKDRSLKENDLVSVQLFSDCEDGAYNLKVISGGVVTGGKSSRMGADKASLTYHGKSFLENCLRNMKEAGLTGLMVSRAYEGDSREKGDEHKSGLISESEAGMQDNLKYRNIYDEQPDRGPLEGIRCIIKNSRTEWTFITAVDIQKADARLIGYLKQFVAPQLDAVCFIKDGKINPLYGFYNNSIMQYIDSAAENGNYRIKDVLTAANTLFVDLDETFDKDILSNVNTPEDYEKLIMPNVITVCGVKNSGKTTLIEGLIKRFVRDGIRPAVIKHDGHEYNEDISATDTGRFMAAGAYKSAVYSSSKHTVYGGITDVTGLYPYMDEADIVIAEGLKDSFLPKIEVVRSEISDFLSATGEEPFIIATDHEGLLKDKRAVHIDDIDEIYRRIKELYK